MIFWALAQRKKDKEKIEAAARAAGMAQGLEEGMAQGREEGMAQGREEGREEGMAQGREEGREEERDRIVREMSEHGIEVPPEILIGHGDRE